MDSNDEATQELLDRILPPAGKLRAGVRSAYGEHPRKYPASDPHRGVDFNYRGLGQSGRNIEHPPLMSPIDGVVTLVQPSLGRIAIRDRMGYSVEILHTQTQNVKEGQRIRAGDQVGTMGGVGADFQHVHLQARNLAGMTVNPLAHLYDLLHPAQPAEPAGARPDFGPMLEFPPRSGPAPAPTNPALPLSPPRSQVPGMAPPDAPPGGQIPLPGRVLIWATVKRRRLHPPFPWNLGGPPPSTAPCSTPRQ